MMANQSRALPRVKPGRRAKDARMTRKRSPAMRLVIDRLEQDDRSLSWLAKKIKVSRQALSAWDDIPPERLDEISKIIGVDKRLLLAT